MIIRSFTDTAASFYESYEVESGTYSAKDRSGNVKDFPLLSVSAAVIRIPEGHKEGSSDELSNILANLKKEAKQSLSKTAYLDMSSKKISHLNLTEAYQNTSA